MGLTKQYLAYKSIGNFNIIASNRPNINFVVYDNVEGRYCVVGAAENAFIWDLRLGKKVLELERDNDNHEVTALRSSPDKMHIAVGYIDGIVKVFNIKDQTISSSSSSFVLSLHKTAVSCIRFDTMGMRLITGGLDTEIVESDMITQSGLSRLIGHMAPITDVHYLDKFGYMNIIVSSSKDMQIKFWNLNTKSCFKTIIDNHSEIWNLGLIGDYLVAGCSENAMNVYKLIKKQDNNNTTTSTSTAPITDDQITHQIDDLCLDDNDNLSPFIIKNYGIIQRSSKGRVVNIAVDNTNQILICHGTNDIIECFYVLTKDEIYKKLQKKLKKQNLQNTSTELNETVLINSKSLTDEIKRLPLIKIKNGIKIKSVDVIIGLNNELRIIVNCSNNTIQLYSMILMKNNSKITTTPQLLNSISQCGHRTDIRSLTFSSDSMIIATCSNESLKIWNRNTLQSIHTILIDSILCCCFVPGNRYILLGTKTGKLLIADIGINEIIEEINQAHKNEIWSICLLPNLNGCCTGSSDTTVKFWDFQLLNTSNNNTTTKPGTDGEPRINNDDDDDNDDKKSLPDGTASSSSVLSLIHKNTLKLDEAVLCIKISPNNKFIAISLLNSTVKIFFLDSFKFYLSLYGHKMPVLCMDISYDSNLIITGSSDRNVKIWGMDFGDCHRTLFAHDDTITGIQFIPNTHMFFSCGKDGKIKQWDGDNFEKILTLTPNHIGEAHCLSVSTNGRYLISSGSDRTLRIYERTDEPIVLKDIQEEERAKNENQILSTDDTTNDANALVPGLKLPSKKTIGAEEAAETILECLEIYTNAETENPDDKIELHPLLLAYGCKNYDEYLMIVLQRICISDLEEALMILPFTSVCKLLEKIQKLMQLRKDQTELLCKIVLFLFKIYYKPITGNHALLSVINNIKYLKDSIYELRDTIGFNHHALQLLQNQINTNKNVDILMNSSGIPSRTKRTAKRKRT